MGHVDDPHDAEGDGQADGGQQQDRAERQAVPDVLRGTPQFQVLADGFGRGLGSGLHRTLRLRGGGECDGKRVAVAPFLDQLEGRDLVGLGHVGFQLHGGAGTLQRLPHLVLSFLEDRGLQGDEHVRVLGLEHRPRRLEPRRRIFGQQRQPAEGGLQFSPEPVVHADLLDREAIGRGHVLAGQGVDQGEPALGFLGDEDFLVGRPDVKLAGQKGLERRDDAVVAGSREGLNLLGRVGEPARAQGVDLRLEGLIRGLGRPRGDQPGQGQEKQ